MKTCLSCGGELKWEGVGIYYCTSEMCPRYGLVTKIWKFKKED